MAIAMLRIDDRLIHGQVVTAWLKTIQVETIWVVDNEVVETPFLINVMHFAIPPGTKLIVTKEEEIEDRLVEFDGGEQGVMVLVKTPRTAKLILDAGMRLRELNIGGMGASRNRKKLFKNISASEEEIEILRSIQKSGVEVYFQVTPNDKKTMF